MFITLVGNKVLHLWEIFVLHLWELCILVVGIFITFVGVITSRKFYYTVDPRTLLIDADTVACT